MHKNAILSKMKSKFRKFVAALKLYTNSKRHSFSLDKSFKIYNSIKMCR